MGETTDEQLVAAEKRFRRAATKEVKKINEAKKLVDAAGRGPRSAKLAALDNQVWLDETTKRRRNATDERLNQTEEGPTQPPSSKKRKVAELPPPSKGTQVAHYTKTAAKPSQKMKGKKPNSQKADRHASIEDSQSDKENIPPEHQDGSDEDMYASEEAGENSAEEASDEGSDDGMDDMSDEELSKTLNNEAPRESTLFDDDEDVEVVTRKRSNRQLDSADDLSDEDLPNSILENHTHGSGNQAVGSVASQKKKVLSVSARDRVLESERAVKGVSALANPPRKAKPNTAPALPNDTSGSSSFSSSNPSDGDEIDDEQCTTAKPSLKDEQRWPESTRLAHGKIKKQNTWLVGMVHLATEVVYHDMLMKHGWPELHNAAAYKREILVRGLETYLEQDPAYGELNERVMRDNDFVKITGTWVLDRLAQRRHKIREAAVSSGLAAYRLGVDTGCKLRVQALMEKDVFTFPGQWNHDDTIWIPTRFDSSRNLQMFLNPAIVACLIGGFFNTPKSWGFKFKHLFVSKDPDNPDEPELTIPMVTLAATAVYSAIHTWREGTSLKSVGESKDRFLGDIFMSIYKRLESSLKNLIKNKKIKTYHHIMHTLYLQSTINDMSIPALSAGDQQLGPLAGIDLDELQ